MRRCTAILSVLALLALDGIDLGARPQRPPSPPATGRPPQAAHLLIDVTSGRAISAAEPERLRTPVLPGSVAKVATLIAALETGVIRPDTRLLCRRRIVSEGQAYTCSHPVLSAPLSASDALAHSCNYYFASIAPRVRRDAFDRALALIGLPPSEHRATMTAAGLGLADVHVTSEQLVRGFARFVASRPSSLSQAAWDAVREGLAGAATTGTASAFRDAGLSALAKTGTAPMPGGGFQGLVVAAVPAGQPSRAIVVLAPGTSGSEAARLAAAVLQSPNSEPRPERPPLRVGRVGQDGRYHVETVGVEEYVARAVAAEATPGGLVEEAKAVAIAARTFAEANRARHAAEGFDLCDLTHCQALRRATVTSRVAAASTRGLVVHDRRGLASVFYSASCGGRSERVSDAWAGAKDLPHLTVRDEPECAGASAWQSNIPAPNLERALRAAGLRGSALRDLAVVARTGSGRVAQVRLDGLEPGQISGERLRLAVGRTLGWQHLKSTLFEVRRTASGYQFNGSGGGHGVGLCVMGAARLARKGQRAESILQTYFPGTSLGTVDGGSWVPRIAVILPAAQERAESELREIASSALAAIAKRTTLPIPEAIRLVFHDSVESYRRATGQPWWTAASTSGTESHFIPLSALRRQGQLARTMTHELAHAVVGDRLAGQPLWVVEGAAMYLGGELGTGTGDTGRIAHSCPSDAEVRRAASRDEARQVHARIAACFATEGRARAASILR